MSTHRDVMDRLPLPVRDAVDVWLRHHDAAAPGVIEGLYLVGSAVLDDWRPSSDVDIIAVTAEPPSEEDLHALRSAHEATTAELGATDVDGPMLVWGDLAQPPAPVVRPWTLAGEFHVDDGCFEINPVTWLTFAEHGVPVRGPVPGELDIPVDPAEVLAFVQRNTEEYWRSVAASIDAALAEDPERNRFDAAMTSWCVLGVARMLFTARTGGVSSKTGAGLWILEELPDRRGLVEHALAVRDAPPLTPPPDDRATVRDTAAFVRDVADLVASVRR